MADRRVKVKYNYFQVCTIDEDTKQEQPYDFIEWLKTTYSKEYKEKICTIKGIRGRLEDILPKGENYYGMRFMRLDELSNTYKAKESERAQHIDLDDDEYIGKSTVALYDPDFNVLMIQSNRGGFGSASIESYIFESTGGDVKNCFLRPISSPFDNNKTLRKNVTKIDIRFANTKQINSQNSGNFKRILDCINIFEGVTAHLEIGLGVKKKKELSSMNNEVTYDTIQVLRENRDNVSSARITIDDDAKSTLFDIFDNVEHDFIDFKIKERAELPFEFMLDKMIETYRLGARNRIMRMNF